MICLQALAFLLSKLVDGNIFDSMSVRCLRVRVKFKTPGGKVILQCYRAFYLDLCKHMFREEGKKTGEIIILKKRPRKRESYIHFFTHTHKSVLLL